jgi:hypothetical protein
MLPGRLRLTVLLCWIMECVDICSDKSRSGDLAGKNIQFIRGRRYRHACIWLGSATPISLLQTAAFIISISKQLSERCAVSRPWNCGNKASAGNASEKLNPSVIHTCRPQKLGSATRLLEQMTPYNNGFSAACIARSRGCRVRRWTPFRIYLSFVVLDNNDPPVATPVFGHH